MMNRGVVGSALAALLIFVSAGCELVEASEVADDSEGGFYVGASASRVEQDVHGQGDIFVGFGLPFGFVQVVSPDRVDLDDTSTGWNVTLGYRINKYFAAELSYYDFGSVAVTERYSLAPISTQIVVRSEMDLFGPGMAVLGSLPLTESVKVFARGGVLFADQEIVTSQNSFRSKRRIGEEIWQAGAGAQWAFTPRWAARLEYQMTESIDGDDALRAGVSKVKQVSLSVLFDL